jgi:hypothetical protein
MPKRKCTKFWQSTCTEWLLKGSRTLIKLDLKFFMHKAFYLGFNPDSNFNRSRENKKENCQRKKGQRARSGRTRATQRLAGPSPAPLCSREAASERAARPAGQRPAAPNRYGKMPTVGLEADRGLQSFISPSPSPQGTKP